MEDKKKNMEFYNKVREVPEEAKKTIGAGRLKGMTDINPMWRIKTLTESFGMCGIGWYFDITDKRIEEGANGEKVSIVDINLFVKQYGKWSKGIAGTGGSKLATKESVGLYTNDECYKMALTDAISVACKNLGIGADVYYSKDRTKYDLEQTTKKVTLATEKQKEIIKDKFTKEEIKEYLKEYKKSKLSELTVVEASKIISNKINEEKQNNDWIYSSIAEIEDAGDR